MQMAYLDSAFALFQNKNKPKTFILILGRFYQFQATASIVTEGLVG